MNTYPDGAYVVNVQNNRIATTPVPLQSYMDSNGISQQPALSMPHYIPWIIGAVVAFFAIVILFKNIFIVEQQTVKVIERLGKFKKTATAGLNFKTPFIDSVRATISLRIQELRDEVTVKTSDNAFVSVPVRVQYSIIAEKAKEATYSLQDIDGQMKSYMLNVVRSTGTSMTMEDIFQSKDKFENAVKESLTDKFFSFGISIVNVLVDNPIPSQEVSEAFNRVIASKRLQEAATNEAEAIRVKTVGLAKAEAESLTLKAKAYVEQRETMVKGMSDLIGTDPNTVLTYLVGIDWRDTIREASTHGNMIVVPSEYGKDFGMVKAAVTPKVNAN